ncbi:MAG: hypothetical protein ACRC20_00035 [Segniliparus sp.]|uniref:hypothetical protein n=1 Tax=Segniliparus sp. TaxID=2804064 RepID=UPI003F34A7C3
MPAEEPPLPPLTSAPKPPRPASCDTWLQLDKKLRPLYDRLVQAAPPFEINEEPSWTWNADVKGALEALYAEMQAQIPVLKKLPDSDLPEKLVSLKVTYSDTATNYQYILDNEQIKDDPKRPQPFPSGVDYIEITLKPDGSRKYVTDFCKA